MYNLAPVSISVIRHSLSVNLILYYKFELRVGFGAINYFARIFGAIARGGWKSGTEITKSNTAKLRDNSDSGVTNF